MIINDIRKKNIFFIIFTIFLILFCAFFIFYSKYHNKFISPELVGHWIRNEAEYLDVFLGKKNIYFLSQSNTINIYDKITGKKFPDFKSDKQILCLQEIDDNSFFILNKEFNGLIKVTNYQIKEKIEIKYLKNPLYFTIDKDLNLYFVDENKIIKYNNGLIIKQNILEPINKFEYFKFNKIYTDNNKIYLLDSYNGIVRIFDMDLNELFWFNSKIKSNNLISLAIDNNGKIYMNDFDKQFIYVFNNNGELYAQFNTDNKNYKITYPAGIIGGINGDFIYVITYNILIFKPL